MVDIYVSSITKFLPTPEKSHYTFSLRDVTRVVQGIVLVPPRRLPDPEKLGRLWIHETYRIFYDRLIDDTDRKILLHLIESAARTQMRMDVETMLGDRVPPGEKVTDLIMRDVIFGNYMEPDADPKIYDEVDNWRNLEKVMNYYLSEYNALSNAPMDLVLFRFAIEHVSR